MIMWYAREFEPHTSSPFRSVRTTRKGVTCAGAAISKRVCYHRMGKDPREITYKVWEFIVYVIYTTRVLFYVLAGLLTVFLLWFVCWTFSRCYSVNCWFVLAKNVADKQILVFRPRLRTTNDCHFFVDKLPSKSGHACYGPSCTRASKLVKDVCQGCLSGKTDLCLPRLSVWLSRIALAFKVYRILWKASFWWTIETPYNLAWSPDRQQRSSEYTFFIYQFDLRLFASWVI